MSKALEVDVVRSSTVTLYAVCGSLLYSSRTVTFSEPYSPTNCVKVVFGTPAAKKMEN